MSENNDVCEMMHLCPLNNLANVEPIQCPSTVAWTLVSLTMPIGAAIVNLSYMGGEVTPQGTQSELHDLPRRDFFPSTVFHHDVGETESEQEHAKRQH